MRIISIANQKGGCGKTTTAINLSACLAENNRRVLLIDMDPQGHSTMGLNIDGEQSSSTMYDVLNPLHDQRKRISEIVCRASKNLDIAPSNVLLSAIEQKLSGLDDRENRLKFALGEVPIGKYNYVIIDCPPSVGLLTFNSLMASHEVIIPIEGSYFSLHGVGKLLETIKVIGDRLGHELSFKALATIYDRRTRMSREVLSEIREHFKENAFTTVIHNAVVLREAASLGKPITQYSRCCVAFEDYNTLANEVILDEAKFGYEPSADFAYDAYSDLFFPRVTEDGVEFVFNDGNAKSVEIAGEFNNWTPEKCALYTENGKNEWRKKVGLKPGTYQYKFIVDGRWQADPNNPFRVEGIYGGFNSVVELVNSPTALVAARKPEKGQI
jgi:chromosome partitioning protein